MATQFWGTLKVKVAFTRLTVNDDGEVTPGHHTDCLIEMASIHCTQEQAYDLANRYRDVNPKIAKGLEFEWFGPVTI